MIVPLIRFAFAIFVLAGCDRVFNIEEVPDAPAQPGPDSTLADDRPEFCADDIVFDSFDGPVPCTYGGVFGVDALDQHNGVVDINVLGSEATEAGCSVYENLTDNGTFVHVTRPMTEVGTYSGLQVRDEPPASYNVFIGFSYGKLVFAHNGITLERTDSPPWWRLRRPTGTDQVRAETSLDGIKWTMWAEDTQSLPASYGIDWIAGVAALPAAADTMTITTFGVCN